MRELEHHLSLFNRKQKLEKVDTSYQDCVDYLRDLEPQDYIKILKVVKTYREADKKVKKILGIKENSVTDPDYVDQLADDLLSDDTELGNFLDDEPPAKVKINKTGKPKK